MMGDKANVERIVYPQAAVCNLIYWPERDSFLLIKKADHKFEGGRWGCLGGKQEYYETTSAAAWREGREEGGPGLNEQTLHHHGVVGVVDDIIRDIQKHYLTAIHHFTVRQGRTPDVSNAEPENHADIRWFPTMALPRNVTTGFRAVVQEVDRIVYLQLRLPSRLVRRGLGWTDEDV